MCLKISFNAQFFYLFFGLILMKYLKKKPLCKMNKAGVSICVRWLLINFFFHLIAFIFLYDMETQKRFKILRYLFVLDWYRYIYAIKIIWYLYYSYKKKLHHHSRNIKLFIFMLIFKLQHFVVSMLFKLSRGNMLFLFLYFYTKIFFYFAIIMRILMFILFVARQVGIT